MSLKPAEVLIKIVNRNNFIFEVFEADRPYIYQEGSSSVRFRSPVSEVENCNIHRHFLFWLDHEFQGHFDLLVECTVEFDLKANPSSNRTLTKYAPSAFIWLIYVIVKSFFILFMCSRVCQVRKKILDQRLILFKREIILILRKCYGFLDSYSQYGSRPGPKCLHANKCRVFGSI